MSASLAALGVSESTVGIVLCVIGSAGTNLGLTVQKYSFTVQPLKAAARPWANGCRIRNPTVWWCIGFTIFLAGQVLNLLAMGFATQAIVATLGSFSLVTNAIFAPLILKERLTRYQVLSIAIIMVGCIAVVLSSSISAQDYSLTELILLYKQPSFIVYAVISVLLLLASLYKLHWNDEHGLFSRPAVTQDTLDQVAVDGDEVSTASALHASKSTPAKLSTMTNGTSAVQPVSTSHNSSNPDSGVLQAQRVQVQPYKLADINDNDIATHHGIDHAHDSSAKLLHNYISDDHMSESHSLSNNEHVTAASPMLAIYATMAGAIYSSFSVLFAKCVMQLVKHTFQYHDNQFLSVWSYVVTLLFLFSAIMSITYLNAALRLGLALLIVPLYYVLSTSLAIIGGLVYFREYQAWTLKSGLLFLTGVLLTIVGVWVATRGNVERRIAEAEEAAEDEQDFTALAMQSATENSPLLPGVPSLLPSLATTGKPDESPVHQRMASITIREEPDSVTDADEVDSVTDVPRLSPTTSALIADRSSATDRQLIRTLSEPGVDLQPLKAMHRRALTPPGSSVPLDHRSWLQQHPAQQRGPRLERAKSVGYGSFPFFEQPRQSFWSGFSLKDLLYQAPLSYRLLDRPQNTQASSTSRRGSTNTHNRRMSVPVLGFNLF